MSSPPSLEARLHDWLVRETQPDIADLFFPWVRNALQDTGHDLSRPATDSTLAAMKTELRRADITPARMQRAVRESERAKAEGLSVLAWTKSLQERAYSKEAAEGATRRALLRLAGGRDGAARDLDAPPTPKEAFAFLLVWEELGGSTMLAAIQELQAQSEGTPPQN